MFGLDTGGTFFTFVLLVALILPFILNAFLAKSRGQNVFLMLLLTLVLSWIVTVILFFMPKTNVPQRT